MVATIWLLEKNANHLCTNAINMKFSASYNKNYINEKLKELKKKYSELNKLSQTEVDIGFPSGKCQPYPNTKTNKRGASVITVAIINAFGTKKIPSRNFMYYNSEKLISASQVIFKKAIEAIMVGNSSVVHSLLEKLGAAGQSILIDAIDNGSYAPNSPSTIARKKSSKPLINTGHLKQSITYVVRRTKK